MAATVTVEDQVTHSLEPEKPDASVVDTVSSEEDAGDELAGFRESTFMSILRCETILTHLIVNMGRGCLLVSLIQHGWRQF